MAESPEGELLYEQQKRVFWDGTSDRRFPNLPTRPSVDELRLRFDITFREPGPVVWGTEHRDCIEELWKIASKAWLRPDHSLKGTRLLIEGEAGSGRSHLVTQFAKSVGTPWLHIDMTKPFSAWALVKQLFHCFADFGTPLLPQLHDRQFITPPCIIVLDDLDLSPSAFASKNRNFLEILAAAVSANSWLRFPKCFPDDVPLEINCREIGWIATKRNESGSHPLLASIETHFIQRILWRTPSRETLRHMAHHALETTEWDVELYGSRIDMFEIARIVSRMADRPSTVRQILNDIEISAHIFGLTWLQAAVTLLLLASDDLPSQLEEGLPQSVSDAANPAESTSGGAAVQSTGSLPSHDRIARAMKQEHYPLKTATVAIWSCRSCRSDDCSSAATDGTDQRLERDGHSVRRFDPTRYCSACYWEKITGDVPPTDLLPKGPPPGRYGPYKDDTSPGWEDMIDRLEQDS